MLNVKSWLVNLIKTDTALQAYLKGKDGNVNVFPRDVDLQPEQFPCITYSDAGVTLLSAPRGMHVGILQLDIWSTNSALEVENIYERLGQLLNYRDSTTQSLSGILWWFREERAMDMHTPSRRLWHKVVDYKFWANNASNS